MKLLRQGAHISLDCITAHLDFACPLQPRVAHWRTLHEVSGVQGLPAIRAIFAHMFVALHEPRFVVTGGFAQGDEAFLTWDFVFRFKRFDSHTLQTVRGATHLRFAADGRVSLHRDYWDAAEELYEKLPVVGGLMRWLTRRAHS